jgi:D-glycero-D-manno-heptose 1,7-bisphosphate phosphatase
LPDALQPAVFIDRDGTLIVEREYLSDPEGVTFVPGAEGAVRRLRDQGFAVVVVTNQSGIARGLYTEEAYHAVARRLDELLTLASAPVDATYYCPHHPDFTGPCECRKPGTGMYRAAARDLGLDLADSFYVGDRLKDVLPAQELGGRGILVRTGYGREEEARLPHGAHVADDLPQAVEWILGTTGRVERDSPAGG